MIEREVSVLLLDLRGYGRLATELSPLQVAALLNRFFEGIGRFIEEEGGQIDKFMGDAVLVLFNTASGQPDHALRATRAALRSLAWARDEFRENDRRFEARAGINTGIVALGGIGTAQRKDVTVIGSVVNQAAVLQTHAGASQAVLGQATYQAVRGTHEGRALPPMDVFGESVQAFAIDA